MKQNIKKYIFSNFEVSKSKAVTKNELMINEIINLTSENGLIEPLNNFSNFADNLVNLDFSKYFYINNASLLNQTTKIIPYEYFNKNTNSFILRLFALDNQFNLFEYDFNSNIFVFTDIKFLKQPTVIYKDSYLYLCSGDDCLIIIDSSSNPLYAPTPANISSSCIFFDKFVFLIENEKYKIFYIDNTPIFNIPNDLSNCFSIELNEENGAVLNIFCLNEKLVVVQQYCISKFQLKTSSLIFEESLFVHSKILENTVCLLEDNIIFCTQNNNVLCFNGNSTSQVFSSSFLNFKNTHACVFNRKYYFNVQTENNECLLVELDNTSNKTNFFNIGNIQDLYVTQTPSHYHLCVVVYENFKYYIFKQNNENNSFKKLLKFNKISFDSNLTKLINEIKFNSKGKFLVQINSDIDSVTFEIENNTELKNISIKGNVFEISITSDESFVIESIFITILEPCENYEQL